MSRPRLLPVSPRALLISTAVIAALLLTVVLAPQMLAREARLQVLRNHVDEAARAAASHVDGDLHRRLIDGIGVDEASLAQARAGLLRLHESIPEAIYIYTMAVKDGRAHFILDTAQDAAFAKRRGLRGSHYMEPFELRDGYPRDWLEQIQAGHTYVNPGFQYDDYGYFLSGNAPIHDSHGRPAGFVAVDFDLDYYLGEEARFRRIEVASVIGVLPLALLLGYLYALFRRAQEVEMQEHFESSMQDSLTGLPNRRGALATIESVWREEAAHTHAALLVDVDNFKSINDTHGHATGDEVLKALSAALRGALRPGDITARLGGDEFLIFARDCDRRGAEQIASRLLEAVRAARAPVPFGVSVGISVTGRGKRGGFDQLYHHADRALYQAKGGGRNRYAVFEPAIQGA